MKFEKWAKEWLEKSAFLRLKTRSYLRYKSIVTNHVLPKLGKTELNKIDGDRIKDLFDGQMENSNSPDGKLSNGTLNLIRTVLKLLFKEAVVRGLIKQNPVDSVARLKTKTTAPKAFSRLEQKKNGKGNIPKQRRQTFRNKNLPLYRAEDRRASRPRVA